MEHVQQILAPETGIYRPVKNLKCSELKILSCFRLLLQLFFAEFYIYSNTRLPDKFLLEGVQSHALRAQGVPQDVVHVRDPEPDAGVGTRRGRRSVEAGRRGPQVILPEGPHGVGAEVAADRVVEERLGDGESLKRGHATLELDGHLGGGDEDLGVGIHGIR